MPGSSASSSGVAVLRLITPSTAFAAARVSGKNNTVASAAITNGSLVVATAPRRRHPVGGSPANAPRAPGAPP